MAEEDKSHHERISALEHRVSELEEKLKHAMETAEKALRHPRGESDTAEPTK
jgi:hypothetical protein